ncbi:MlaD family protein [Sediminicoccus sp. KRV36]|uniref:MlaD family protein n=1 Tax=Sediminicoccus sp. KRV36 TaxID=3133721 RepID=UPI00200E2E58|nr:MlaD family protein [Sediminicoccus rosea]UPY37761.1 MlaD family protein [Sediminicoccus rosea]
MTLGRLARFLAMALLLLPVPAALGQGGATLRVLLPIEGTGGLEPGADVQVLGLKAGTVQRISFGPQRRLVAEILIEQPEARDHIRRDSPITVRSRLGGVGSAFLFIGRGEGPPLDWAAASLEAASEPSQLQVLEQLRDRALPVLEDLGRVSRFAVRFVEGMERGQGSFGRLMTDDQFARNAEETVRELTALLRGGGQLVQRFDGLAVQAERLMAESGPNSSLPALMRRVDQALANLQQATRDVSRASQRLPQTVRNLEESTGNVPGVLLQTQQTTRELELLLTQLRGMWLLGGSGPPAPEPRRPAAERLRP